MSKNLALMLALLGALVACGGDGDGSNPVNKPPQEEEDDSDIDLPDGTEDATANDPITRYEPQDGTTGNGYASNVSYDPATDTFTVDNLGFDGNNVYRRDDQVASLGPFAVYEASENFFDSVTGERIEQLTDYKAIYGVSQSGQTEFAIVRTGAYVDYGFGGYVYSRNGGVTLPTTGQAAYSGDYAGLRDFTNRGGIEYTTGDMNVAIDFEDFNEGSAVQGTVFNRRIFDTAGNDITDDIIDALGSGTELPALVFSIGPGVLSENGELAGEIASFVSNEGGGLETFESGNYYAVLSGNNAEEIVGVIVVNSDDPRFDGVGVRETGGFILTR